MKIKLSLICFLSALILLPSCIKEEGVYREADIIKFALPDSIITNILYEENKITVVLKDTAGLNNTWLTPQIIASEGAMIIPKSGDSVSIKDYKTTYTIVPENLKNSFNPTDSTTCKTYVINFVQNIPLNSSFENWVEKGTISKKYKELDETSWKCANAGIRIVYPKNTRFPTRDTTDSYSGKYAALMETMKGQRSILVDSPIYAGSLFRGDFKIHFADPILSAKFGIIQPQYIGRPTLFSGYYKYIPGESFQDENEVIIPGRIDECSIFAALFKVEKGQEANEFLTAYDLEDIDDFDKLPPQIIAVAVLKDRTEKKEYTKFSIPFVYREEPDYQMYDYKLTVVFSSSKEGNFFRGAIGSMLTVDDVAVQCVPYKSKRY